MGGGEDACRTAKCRHRRERLGIGAFEVIDLAETGLDNGVTAIGAGSRDVAATGESPSRIRARIAVGAV